MRTTCECGTIWLGTSWHCIVCGDWDESTRWIYQPWYVKVYRWFRYIPLAYAIVFFDLNCWACAGARPLKIDEDCVLSRWETIEHILTVRLSLASSDMGRCESAVELLRSLRNEH